jgi:hypothetical protein
VTENRHDRLSLDAKRFFTSLVRGEFFKTSFYADKGPRRGLSFPHVYPIKRSIQEEDIFFSLSNVQLLERGLDRVLAAAGELPRAAERHPPRLQSI